MMSSTRERVGTAVTPTGLTATARAWRTAGIALPRPKEGGR
ncbi:hypothetical protein ACIGXM_32645 [Kitasatospora sp. NPDC052896]